MSALQLRCHNHVAALLDGHCLRSSAEASDRQDLGRNDPEFPTDLQLCLENSRETMGNPKQNPLRIIMFQYVSEIHFVSTFSQDLVIWVYTWIHPMLRHTHNTDDLQTSPVT